MYFLKILNCMVEIIKMKIFDVDGIKVNIPMDMYNVAVKTHVFNEELTEEDKEGNRIYLRSIIAAAFRESLDDLGKSYANESTRGCFDCF